MKNLYNILEEMGMGGEAATPGNTMGMGEPTLATDGKPGSEPYINKTAKAKTEKKKKKCKECDKEMKESLLDDEDDMINDQSQIEKGIRDWIADHYSIYTSKNSDIVINNGVVTLDAPGVISSKPGRSLSHITNGQFKFGKIDGDFIVHYGASLKDFKGCPPEVTGDFTCKECKAIMNLSNMPKVIGGDFKCEHLWGVDNFRTMPRNIKIGGSIVATDLIISSTKGLPAVINGDLDLSNCDDLEDLEGIKEIKGNLILMGCSYQVRHTYKDKDNCPIKIKGKVLI